MKRAISALVAAGLASGALASAAPASPSDGYAWEFVSPIESEGVNVEPTYAWGWTSGDHALYATNPLPVDTLVARRGGDGWAPWRASQQAPDVVPIVVDGNADLSRAIVFDQTSLRVRGLTYTEGLYVHESGGRVTPIVTWQIPDPVTNATHTPVFYLGGSDDKHTLYLFAHDNVLDGLSNPTALYRWRDGAVEPITLDDARYQACPTRAVVAGVNMQFTDNVDPVPVSLMQNGISADGETIVVRTGTCNDGSTTYPAHLYVVRGGQAVDISAPLPGETDGAATFVGMSRDGDRVFFTTPAKLVADDDNGRHDLYMWSATDGIQRLSGAQTAGAAVVRSAMASPDGSTVWFDTQESGSPVRWELYAWRDGTVAHVATPRAMTPLHLGRSQRDPTQLSWDGSVLLFATSGSVFEDIDPRGMSQLYRVTIDGAVTCVSCDEGVAISKATTGEAMWGVSYPVPRMSRDGSTIAFATEAVLDARDTNGRADVYVWRDDGTPHGAHALVSSGTVPADASVHGISWDGRTAFFLSWGAFVPGTTDQYRKLYAARVDGGFPLPQPPAPCGADCQGPLTPAPFLPVPGSEQFSGRGNVTPTPTATLAVARVGAQAQRQMARSGRVTIVARSNVAATIRAGLRVRIGRRWVRADRRQQRLQRAGAARIRLTLSRRARRTLAQRGALRVRITVASSRVSGQRRASFVLRTGRTAKPSRGGRANTTTHARAGSGRDA